MTNKQMLGIADEYGCIRQADYQELKNQLSYSIPKREELERLILRCSARILASRRKPENVARKQTKKGGKE